MATVKKSKTKKIVWAVIACILVVALIVGGVAVKSNNKKTEVTLNTISTESIVQTVSSTGTIGSGLKREYKPGTVATVKTVNVKVGDKVKKGTVLATFDTSSLDSQVTSLGSAYSSANASYQEAVKHQKAAKAQLDAINDQIEDLEEIVAEAELQAEKTTAKSTTKKPTTTTTTTTKYNYNYNFNTTTTKKASPTTCPNGTHVWNEAVVVSKNSKYHYYRCKDCYETKAVEHSAFETLDPAKGTDNYHVYVCSKCGNERLEAHIPSGVGTSKACTVCGKSLPTAYTETSGQTAIAMIYVEQLADELQKLGAAADQITQMREDLRDLANSLEEVAANVNTMTIIFSTIASEVMSQLVAGNFSADKIADAVGKSVSAAIKQGMVEFIDSGAAVEMIETAMKNVDWKAIGKGISSSENFVSTAAQVQLTALYAQKEVYSVTASMSTVNAQKQAVEATRNAYQTMKSARDDLSAGWTADFTGVITTCDIVAGGQTTALQTGITLENMKQRVITISLGEYDVHKVKLGMDATVKTAYGTYDGVVEFIAPTATGGSDSSMLDSVGSMAGISGLSSLTSSGAGVECKILVEHPDENIIVGFDADVEIVTGSFNDIPAVPIESIVLEKEGTYVYLYDPEEETVTKTKIETGATSDTSYEVKSGLTVGQQIVATPQTNYEEDTFKVKVVEKK